MTQPSTTFTTICQHTFEDRLPGDENKAPFHCLDTNSFVGRGFYFWDDNLQVAKYWGGLRYHNKGLPYLVGEAPFECDWNDFFDLVGSRRHQKFLLDVRRTLAGRRPQRTSWPIGNLIEFLKASNIDPECEYFNKFNFKAIRAVDDSFSLPKDQIELMKELTQFAGDTGNYTYLNPCYLICVISKKDISLKQLTVVHSSKQAR